jgi:tetratricopeptide (TPR) repeat protein
MADLREVADERLDAPLTLWRRWREPGRVAHLGSLPPDLAGLATSVAKLFGWTDERARSAAPSAAVPGGAPSAGGPAGLFQLAEAVGQGRISSSVAVGAARELGVGDDDVMFLVAFAAKDPRYSDPGTAGAMFLLAGETVRHDALGGRLLRNLAAMSDDSGRQYQLLRDAEGRLSGGADDRLRAEVWNELAILLVGMGSVDEARELAEQARELALAAGDPRTAAMALGNQAVALMQKHRFPEAIGILEQLAEEQERLGDAAGLAVTRENLEISRANL